MKFAMYAGTLFIAISLVFSGCSSKGKPKDNEDVTGIEGETTGGGAAGPEINKYGDNGAGGPYGGAGKGKYGAGGAGATGDAALDDPSSPLFKRVIYFMYDSSEVSPEYVPVVNAHAEYLAANPGKSVTLEGHADERGSSEYNVALGEQRAKEVANLMKLHGVNESQLQIVSFGEEKPAISGSDESAYQQNRRVEIAYSGH